MVDTRDEVVVRLRPRPNLEVNRHFICDTGRLDYRWMNRGDRIEAPLVREGSRLVPTDWDGAITRLAGMVRDAKSVVVLASGRASTEALGSIARLVRRAETSAVVKVPTGPEAPLVGVPNLSLRAERVPNLNGAQLLGYTSDWSAGLAAAQRADLVLLLDAELDDRDLTTIAAAKAVVLIGTVDDDRLDHATLILPTTTMVEENGSYVNRDNRVQRYFQAKGAPGMARPAWWIGASASVELEGGSVPATAGDAFAELTRALTTFDDLTYQDLGFVGRVVGRTAEAAR